MSWPCRRCPENGDPFGSRYRLPPNAPRNFLPSSSPLHDAHLQPFAPDFRSPRVALPVPIPWHGLFEASLAAEKTAMDRNTYGEIIRVSPSASCKLMSKSSFLLKNAADRQQPPQNDKLPKKQRTPRSPKTGRRRYELKTAWIQHPI